MENNKPREAIMAQRFFVPVELVTTGMLSHFEYKLPKWMITEDMYELQLEIRNNLWLTYAKTADGQYYAFHRGDLEKITRVFKNIPVRDMRCQTPLGIDLKFVPPPKLKKDKWEKQKAALKQFIDPNVGGIFVANPAFGKTLIMTVLMILIRYKSLVIVNKRDLMTQIRGTLDEFTNLKQLEAEAGIPLAGELSVQKGQFQTFPISLATYQLFVKHKEKLSTMTNEFGLVFIDECHHAPADFVRYLITSLNPMLRIGVTATPMRKDGWDILLPDLIGPIRYRDPSVGECTVYIEPGMELDISPNLSSNWRWQIAIKQIVRNENRNSFILNKAAEDVRLGRKVLVLTNRREHAKQLCAALIKRGVKCEYLLGGEGDAKVKNTLAYVNAPVEVWNILKEHYPNLGLAPTPDDPEHKEYEGLFGDDLANYLLDHYDELQKPHQLRIDDLLKNELEAIVATWQKFGEGSDCPMLSSVHITVPTSNKPFITQIIGRVQRDVKGKPKAIAHYYSDYGNVMQVIGCKKAFVKTCREEGYEVQDPFAKESESKPIGKQLKTIETAGEEIIV